MTGIVRLASIHQRRYVLSVVFVCLPTIARAEVRVEGSPAVVRVTTSRDTISDVLSALAATFNVQYRTAIPLNAAAGATYSGSFRQVISRLLDGYNYTIKTDDSKTTEIVVLSKRGEAINPPKAPTDKPEVASVQSNTDESSPLAVGLCISMGNVKLDREPSKKRVISRTFTCGGDLAKNLKLALAREAKETLEGFVRRYAPGGARAKTIEYECPETDRCTVIVKF
jgi:hypothetical protein